MLTQAQKGKIGTLCHLYCSAGKPNALPGVEFHILSFELLAARHGLSALRAPAARLWPRRGCPRAMSPPRLALSHLFELAQFHAT